MEETKISYKSVDPRCDVHVRELNRHKAAIRLITSNKRKVASAGLIVPTPSEISAGSLVEIDLSFPGIPLIYRSRGVVDWMDNNAGKMGVLVFGMDKVNPNADSAPGPNPGARTSGPTPQPAQESADEQPSQEDIAPETQSEPSPELSPESPSEKSPLPEAAVQSSEAEPEKKPGMSMPDDEDVAELFSGLVDAEVDVKANTDKPLKEKRFAVIGEYQNDEGNPVLLMAADVALVNFLGSALVMLPKDEAESANKNNTMSEEIQESFQEICNISSSLINDAGNSHVRFSQMYVSKSTPPPENVKSIISNYSNKMDFTINIPGYGSGRLSLIDGTWK